MYEKLTIVEYNDCYVSQFYYKEIGRFGDFQNNNRKNYIDFKDGPGRIIYYDNAHRGPVPVVQEVSFFQNNRLHRENGPAQEQFFKSGNLSKQHYMRNGHYHRVDGPAIIKYDREGKVKQKLYFIDGNEIPIDIVEWCLDRKLSIANKLDNIPEKYKIEFKLKFL